MDNVRLIIAANLRNLCKAKKMKQIDVAAYLGISQASVAKWFSGANGIDIDNLYKLCVYLGVSVDQILGMDPIGADFSASEIRLINVYRTLSTHGQQKVESYADDMAMIYKRPETIEEADERMLKTAEAIASADSSEKMA